MNNNFNNKQLNAGVRHGAALFQAETGFKELQADWEGLIRLRFF